MDKLADNEKSLCNRCATNIAGLCRHCPEEECGWDLCLACCQDLASHAAAAAAAEAGHVSAVVAADGGGGPPAAAPSLKAAAVGSSVVCQLPAAAAGGGGKDSNPPHLAAVGVAGRRDGEGRSGGTAAGEMTGASMRAAYVAEREKLRQSGWVMTCPNPKCPSVVRRGQQQGAGGGKRAAAGRGTEGAAGGDGNVTGGQLRCMPGAAALGLVRIVKGQDPLAALRKVAQVRGGAQRRVLLPRVREPEGGRGGAQRWVMCRTGDENNELMQEGIAMVIGPAHQAAMKATGSRIQ